MYDIITVKWGLNLIADRSIHYAPLFTKLDSYSGDGDMGATLSKGAQAIKNEIAIYQGTDIGTLFARCGMTLNRCAPSTLGTLLSSCLIMLGKKFRNCDTLSESDIVNIPICCSDTIMLRGNAQQGDKTILDALIPLSVTFAQTFAKTNDLEKSLQYAAQAAKQGAKHTRGMLAKIGRAKWIADRAKDYPDSGAVFCAIVIDAFVDRNKPNGYRLPDYQAMYAKREKRIDI